MYPFSFPQTKAGDADTNGATAGALLGCKLGVGKIPDTWLNGLVNKPWLDKHIERYKHIKRSIIHLLTGPMLKI